MGIPQRDVFDYVAVSLAFLNVVGLFIIVPVVRGFLSLRSHMDHIEHALLERIEALERWRAAETGEP